MCGFGNLQPVSRHGVSKFSIFCHLCNLARQIYFRRGSQLWLPEQIHMLHHLDIPTIVALIPSLIGGDDWYVKCILMFYTIYYVATFLSDKFHWNQTLLLGGFLWSIGFGHTGITDQREDTTIAMCGHSCLDTQWLRGQG